MFGSQKFNETFKLTIMKKQISFFMASMIAMSVIFFSCKKTDTETTNDGTELAIHSDDQARFSNETDAVANDANTIIDNYNSFSGRIENTTGIICDATTTIDSANGLRRITITYNGLNCNGTRTRTGVVLLTMLLASHWKDAGAVLTIEAQNLKITRVIDGKSITINGTETITNVTGGRLINLAALGTIRHAIASPGVTVTFDNGTSRSWQIAKQREFTYNNGIVITTTGTHTDGSISGISEWGTNRFGNAFVTAITQPMIIRQDCSFRLTAGQVTHQHLLANIVVTFGLDATGNPTTCPTGVYYFKAVWAGVNGIVRTYILPY